MGGIYRNAFGVRIFLGHLADDSDIVPSFVKKLVQLNAIDDPTIMGQRNIVRGWIALAALMRRGWFTRQWCVQEIAFAKTATLYVGSKIIEWQDFADAVMLLNERNRNQSTKSAEFGSSPNPILTQHSYLRQSSQIGRLASIETLASVLSSYNVRGSRDAIYALRSLGKITWETKNQLVEPDYGPHQSNPRLCATPTPHVYAKFVKFVVE
ncbi:hypothetical protein G7Y89_g14490 [Cudoniella acicularis]|uniref:Heterokaryon incompatibility domain-containing protein n=1 Tax=Cudoniella acicularis TaxID=354080 RepID=A0A8H4R3X9_9HELO|nr:hypothetical protein G7Y89_g14490 [Cudoniella acicularis]